MIRVNLALQGGGAHGAFTWGVLDRLLEEEDIEVAGISGTSAGAINGAAFKAGWNAGGRQGAKDALDGLWGDIGAVTNDALSAWIAPFAKASSYYAQALTYSPIYAFMDQAARMWSPYMFAGAVKNPLERILADLPFDHICAGHGPALYVGATNVRTGKIRIFSGQEITTDALLASACLPTLFEAIEIADPATGQTEAYWDGGYSGNPALFPLFENDLPDDIMIVTINPMRRDALPKDATAIQNRINEISFNSSLLRELRAISFVKRLIDEGAVKKGRMKDVLVHIVDDNDLMNELSVATKLIVMPVVLARLKQGGRDAMDRFLAQHKGNLGKRSSVDLQALYS